MCEVGGSERWSGRVVGREDWEMRGGIIRREGGGEGP